ncbi:MAG: hypothetical protein HY901_24775, partial [Deltaproteobacteria bacterium]|nr:hypothetical protein [Deltaproteobacteria bacterium]
DEKDAFDRFIVAGGPAYVERYKLESAEAIALVRRAGGTATLAHAATNRITPEEVRQLKDEGLAGLEIDHPDHPPEVRQRLRELAQELDLVPTAGSDFHGEIVVPGRRLGAMHMKPSDLERLRQRAQRPDLSATSSPGGVGVPPAALSGEHSS